MPTLDVYNLDKEKVGTLLLKEEVFGAKVNVALVHQVIKAQLAGRRQGTAKTKTKSEVRGGGRKPFRQKGTGNARQGSIRSPLQPGGGESFGPQPRSYAQATPKEMIRGALRSALSDRVRSERFLVIEDFTLPQIKTQDLNRILKKNFKIDQVILIDQRNEQLELSARNIPKVKFLRAEGLNVYDLIRNEWVVMTKRAIAQIEKHLTVYKNSSELVSQVVGELTK